MELNKFLSNKGVLIGGAVVILLLLYFAFSGSSVPTPAPGTPPPPTAPAGSPAYGNPTSPTPPSSSKPPVAPPPPKGGFYVVSPQAGDRWVMGQTNTIKWNKETGNVGGIYLADAQTGQTVGWILVNTGPNQTSYTWQSQSVALSRTNPNQKDVPPGSYVIKLTFEKPSPDIQSGVFSLITPAQVISNSQTITVKGGVASPQKIAINKGEKITLVNSDSVSYSLKISVAFPTLALPANGSVVLDTATLGPGEYQFYSEQYPGLKGTFILK